MSKYQVWSFAGLSGLRWPGDRKKPSSRAKGSPKAAGQKQLFSLSLADGELFEMRIHEDRTGLTLWRDAVRRSKSGAGKARVETGAGTAPRTASAPPPTPHRLPSNTLYLLYGFRAGDRS